MFVLTQRTILQSTPRELRDTLCFLCCISFSKHRRIIAHVHTAHLTCKNWQQCNNACIIVSRINGSCISQIIFTTFPTWLLLPTNLMITTGWFVYNNILCSKRTNVLVKSNSPKYLMFQELDNKLIHYFNPRKQFGFRVLF